MVVTTSSDDAPIRTPVLPSRLPTVGTTIFTVMAARSTSARSLRTSTPTLACRRR